MIRTPVPSSTLRSRAVLLVTLAVVTSASAARATPSYLACIGDSITQGYASSTPSLDWVGDLSTLLGPTVAVTNDGVASTTMMKQSNFSYWTNGDLPQVESFVADAGASADVAIIVMLGTNDSKDNPNGVYNWDATAPTRYAADYNAMIDTLQALTPKPQIFLALPPPAFQNGDSIDDAVLKFQIIPIILGIAEARQLPVIDVRAPLEGMSSVFVDGVHPNDQGHMIIAQAMYAGLKSPMIPGADGGVEAGVADAGDASTVGAGDAGGVADATTVSDTGAANEAGDSEDASEASDAATGAEAAGSVPNDAGSPGDSSDAGAVAAASEGSGCGCGVAGRGVALLPVGWAAIALLAAVRRRKRTAGEPRPRR